MLTQQEKNILRVMICDGDSKLRNGRALNDAFLAEVANMPDAELRPMIEEYRVEEARKAANALLVAQEKVTLFGGVG